MSRVNPYSTARVRPDAVDYVMPAGWTFEQLLARFEAVRWRGQIVGPHGSGKSSLLWHLLKTAPLRFSLVEWWTIRPARRWWAPATWDLIYRWDHGDARPDGPILTIAEGWEWLRPWRRWASQCWGKLSRRPLIVTGHRRLVGGGPVILETTPQEDTFCEISRRLQVAAPDPLSDEVARSAFRRHHGDMREALFDLYDQYQAKG